MSALETAPMAEAENHNSIEMVFEYDEATERDRRTSILLGQKTAPFALMAMQEFGIKPRRTAQTYTDGKPIDPGTRTVAVGWYDVVDAEGEPIDLAQALGTYAYRLAVHATMSADRSVKSYAQLQDWQKRVERAHEDALFSRAKISETLRTRGA